MQHELSAIASRNKCFIGITLVVDFYLGKEAVLSLTTQGN